MPYKLTFQGELALTVRGTASEPDLTPLQYEILEYLFEKGYRDTYVRASEVANALGHHPQAVSGSLYSLFAGNFVVKGIEEIESW
ncbi:hypothetical protein LCGC14_0730740 [marine sediment metagenome]|uniref:Uncharacterized protein n=1 Tax=marine sediment metagenome TaxID=412755 RepID=A0A0F9Q9P9_9ZZZZ